MKSVVKFTTGLAIGLLLAKCMELSPLISTSLGYILGVSHMTLLTLIDKKMGAK